MSAPTMPTYFNGRFINLPKADCNVASIHPIVCVVLLDLIEMLECLCQQRSSTGTALEVRRSTTHQDQSSQCSIMGIRQVVNDGVQ